MTKSFTYAVIDESQEQRLPVKLLYGFAEPAKLFRFREQELKRYSTAPKLSTLPEIIKNWLEPEVPTGTHVESLVFTELCRPLVVWLRFKEITPN